MPYFNRYLISLFIFTNFSSFALYIPVNTRSIGPEQAETQVKQYYACGLTAQEGLLKTLEDDEKHQLKIMFDFLGLDAEQAYNENQRFKQIYKKLKPEQLNAFWHINLTSRIKFTFIHMGGCGSTAKLTREDVWTPYFLTSHREAMKVQDQTLEKVCYT